MTKTLFTTPTCTRCAIVKSRLDQAGIEYSISQDEDRASELGIQMAPAMLLEDGTILDFGAIIKAINGGTLK